jgi:peptidoglycan hydrolase-like protein with peptidoglycan-binding domain
MSRKASLGLLLVAASFLPCLFAGCSREKEEGDDPFKAAKLLLETTLPAYIDVSKFEGKYTQRSPGSSDGIMRFKAQIKATEDLYEPTSPSLETRQLLASVQAENRRVGALVGGSLEVSARLNTEMNKLRNDVQSFTTIAEITKKDETRDIFGTATISSHPHMRADKLELETKVDLGKPLADYTRAVLVGAKEEAEARAEIGKQLASVKDAFMTAQTEIEYPKKEQVSEHFRPYPVPAPTPTPATPAPASTPPPSPTPASTPTPAPTPPPASTTAMPDEARMSEADRLRVQDSLHRRGYYDWHVDGVFGRLTRAAIRRFQHDIGAKKTGHLTAEEASHLVSTH